MAQQQPSTDVIESARVLATIYREKNSPTDATKNPNSAFCLPHVTKSYVFSKTQAGLSLLPWCNDGRTQVLKKAALFDLPSNITKSAVFSKAQAVFFVTPMQQWTYPSIQKPQHQHLFGEGGTKIFAKWTKWTGPLLSKTKCANCQPLGHSWH